MSRELTEIVFILDRSGSMEGLEADTIGGFNSMMEKQKKEEGEAFVTTILFDDKYEMLHDRIPIDQVPKMTGEQYYVRGCTALLDAMGKTIRHIEDIHKYAREEDRPAKTLFVITTDGMENASRDFGYEEIKKLVERQQEKYGWEFIFIGANIDAIEAAGRIGIRRENAVDYVHDGEGTAQVYNCVTEAVRTARRAKAGHMAQAMAACSWSAGIRQDFEKRGSRKKKG